MKFNFKNKESDKISNKGKRIGEIRKSHLLTHCGPGSVVDMPDYSVVMAAIDYWDNADKNIDDGYNDNVLHEMNLERLLGVEYFREPNVQIKDDYSEKNIPAFRFPKMHYCPGCGRLMPFYSFGEGENKKCDRCNRSIIPSRFIAICENGHMQDFPYSWWVHKGSNCSKSNRPRLKIKFSDTIGTLKGVTIYCEDCGAKRTMDGVLADSALAGCKCFGNRPWIGNRRDDQEPYCEGQLRAVLRTASNVYFPKTINALTIPPWSHRVNKAVESKRTEIKNLYETINDPTQIKQFIGILFKDLISSNEYNLEEIIEHIDLIRQAKKKDEYKIQNIIEDEYKVLCKEEYVNETDIQYRRIGRKVPDILKPYIKQIGKVQRLREVMSLYGFNRVKAGGMNSPYVDLGKESLDWLPAIEMLGEGIFIEFDENAISRWERRNGSRYELMRDRLEDLEKNYIRICDNFSPRYVLLHSISHLLIRQLTFECGYSGASIKERIYSTYPGSEEKMSGILLYTASTDSDGSLGGLARQAESESMENIFMNMLEEASWCSSDPICGDSTSQGYESLNYAACHACTLLPETCCEMMNCLLDRVAVVGKVEDREMGFMGNLLI